MCGDSNVVNNPVAFCEVTADLRHSYLAITQMKRIAILHKPIVFQKWEEHLTPEEYKAVAAGPRVSQHLMGKHDAEIF